MKEEKWFDIKQKIEDNFQVLENYKEDASFADDLGHKIPASKEIIIFLSPQGKLKLEFLKKPLILDEKIHYQKTHGTGAQKEYVVSPDEFTFRFSAYKWDEIKDDWEKFEFEI